MPGFKRGFIGAKDYVSEKYLFLFCRFFCGLFCGFF